MARRRIASSQSPILKWREQPVGYEVAGTYKGMREGKFGWLSDIVHADGSSTTIPLPTVLEKKLRDVPRGADVWIIFAGPVETKAGGTYFDFLVDVDDEAEATAAPATAAKPSDDGDDTPF